MAISGLEWLVVVGIVAIIFLWSPQKLPELAKALGQAKREFDKAVREVTTTASTSPPAVSSQSEDTLIQTARKLGISTEGKTKDQISQEIISKAQSK